MKLCAYSLSSSERKCLAISVKANVRAANVMPELKQAAYAGSERMTIEWPIGCA